MSRPLRIQYPGAWYHAMNRGGARREVYKNNDDRRLFLDVIERACERFGVEVHAYCLMGNHYHLLLRTPEANLSRYMQYVDGVYTQSVNRHHGLDGPLFKGRYKAYLVDADNYLLAVNRYIHLNPVEARLVATPATYCWSSYRDYVQAREPPQWLRTDFVLAQFGSNAPRQSFVRFVAAGIDDETRDFFAAQRLAPVLGTSTFKQKLTGTVTPDREVPQRKSLDAPVELTAVIVTVANSFSQQGVDLTRRRGARNDARDAAISLYLRFGRITASEVARAFNCGTYSAVSEACRRLRQRRARDPALDARVAMAENRLLMACGLSRGRERIEN